MAATYRDERTEFRKLSAKVTGRKQFSRPSVFVVLRCATILCPVNSVTLIGTRRTSCLPCRAKYRVARRIGERQLKFNRTLYLPPTAHVWWRSRGSKSGEIDDGRSAAIYEVSKLHVVSREIYGIGVVQVSGILGIGLPPRHAGRGTSYYRGGPIYRAPVSDRDLFDAPSRVRTHHHPPPILADVNFKGNFEEWFPGFPGMIVVRKGWNVIKG